MSGSHPDPPRRDDAPDTQPADPPRAWLTAPASQGETGERDSDGSRSSGGVPGPSTDSVIAQRIRADAEAALALVRAGKLRTAGLLGEGGAGVVHSASDLSLKREVAIKALRAPGDPSARVRFVDEAQITGQLQHPNIVPVYELALDDNDAPVLLMKRVHGRTLREVIDDAHAAAPAGQPLSARDQRHLLESFIKICDAIEFAHSKRILHRDLKPDNVMIGEFGEVLVMDWGLAKPIGGLDEYFKSGRRGVITDRRIGEVELTMDGALSGTLPYMAPEQAEGRNEDLDETADIYALGAILYTILANSPPFVGGNAFVMQRRVIAGDFPRPSERAANRVPPELEAITVKAMHRSRRQRYASVVRLREDVERYLDGRTVSVTRYSVVDRVRKWVAANRGLSAGIAATIIALMVGGVVALVHLREAEIANRDRELRQADADAKAAQIAERAAIDEQQAREIQIRNLLQEGEIDQLAGELGLALEARYAQLVDEFTQMIDEAEDRGIGFDLLSVRLREGKLDEYLEAYNTLFDEHERRPEHVAITAEHHAQVAQLLIVAKRSLDDARAHLDVALRTIDDPTDRAHLYSLYGMSYGVEKRYAEAEPFFLQAVGIEPDKWELQYNLAVAYRGERRFQHALARMDEALRLQRTGQVFCARGLLRAQMGETHAGLADIEQAVDLEPNNPAILATLAQLLLLLARPTEALANIDAALAITPDHADRHTQRGRVLGALGRTAEALAEFAIAGYLDPADPSPHFYRGQTMRAYDNAALAIEAFSRTLELNPHYELAIYWRGISYFELGEHEKARADFDAVVAIDPDNTDYRLMRAGAFIALRRFQDALTDLDVAITANPNHWQALVNRGLARVGLGDREGGRLDFDRAKALAPASALEAIEELEASTFDDG